MTTTPRSIRIFISSPGDVVEERDGARRVINGLQRLYPGIQLIPVLWEELALPATASFQETIDVLVGREPIDVAVFVLWSRLGSPLGASITRSDGTPYRSGTERELDLMLTAFAQSGMKRPVILAYTRDDDVAFKQRLTELPTTQLEEFVNQRKLAEAFIREQFHDAEGRNLRAYQTYREPVGFLQRLRLHLRQVFDELIGGEAIASWIEEPYRGLETFDIQHAPIFYGREAETCDLLQRLRDQDQAGCAFVVIVGASGSGKSSLARAGIAASLIQHHEDDQATQWRSSTFVPTLAGDDLCEALVRSISEVLPDLIDSSETLSIISQGLGENPSLTVRLSISPAFVRASANGRIRWLLVLDQMEELWTDRHSSNEHRERFLGALEALARSGHVAVLATLRSDFYGRAQEITTFVRLKGKLGQFDLLPPDAPSLHHAIIEPARISGLKFERNERIGRTLDEVILEDAMRDSHYLPLLEYVLSELYRQRDQSSQQMTYAAYVELGGIEGAIGKRAEEALTGLPSAAQAAFDEILPLLVSVDVAGEQAALRRRARMLELTSSDARKVLIDRLIADRFLTTDRLDDQPIATLAHEALLRRWDRIVRWIETNREHLRLRARVEQSQQRWQGQNRDKSLLLADGLPLNEGRQLLDKASFLLAESTKEYISASIANYVRNKIGRRRMRVFVSITIAGLLLAVGLGYWQSIRAEGQRDTDRRANLLTLSVAADTNMQLARAEINAGRWNVARKIIAEAVKGVNDVPELVDRRLTLVSSQARLDDLIEFYSGVDQTELLGSEFSQNEEGRAAAKAALDRLHVFESDQWWVDLPDADLSTEQQQRLREDIYRLILIYAGFYLQLEMDQLDKLEEAETKNSLESALAIVEAANRYRHSFSGRGMSLVCRFGLNRLNLLDAFPLGEPVTATDHYLFGIAHLALGQIDINDDLIGIADRFAQWNGLRFDLKEPNKMAQKHLTRSTLMDPTHYWGHFWLGHCYYQMREFEHSQTVFNTCVTMRPDFGPAYFLRGRATLGLADNRAADTDSSKFNGADAGSQFARKRVEQVKLSEELTQLGLLDLDQAIRLNPELYTLSDRAEAFQAAADRAEDFDRCQSFLTRSLADWDQVLSQNPNDEWACYYRSKILLAMGRPQLALTDIEHYLRLVPDDRPAASEDYLSKSDGQAVRGQARLHCGDPEGSLADFIASLGSSSNSQSLLVERATALRQVGRAAESISLLDLALRDAWYQRCDYYDARGLAHAALGDLNAALADFRSSFSQFQNRGFQSNRWSIGAIRAADPHRYEQVIRDLEQEIQVAPQRTAEILRCRALLNWGRGKLDEAHTDLTASIALEPTARVLHWRAILSRESNDLEQSLADLDEAVRRDPSDLEVLLYRASLHASAKRFDQAMADYTEALRIQPDQAEAYNFRGVLRLDNNLIEAAHDDFSQAIRLSPRNSVYLANRGAVWMRMNQMDNALLDLNDALQHGNYTAHILGIRSQLFEAQGDSYHAAADLAEAVRLDASNTYRERLARLYANLRNYALAAKTYSDLLERDPNNAPHLNSRGLAYLSSDIYDKALADFNRASTLMPQDVNYRMNRGFALYNQGRFDGALEDFDAILKVDANHLGALGDRVTVFGSMGDYARADAVCSEMIKLETDQLAGLLRRIDVRLQFRKFNEVEDDLLRVAEISESISPGNPSWRAKALITPIVLRVRQGRLIEAEVAANRAVTALPNDASALILRARVLARLGKIAEAERDIANSIRVSYDSHSLAATRGFIAAQKGEWERASELYSQAIGLHSNSPGTWGERALVELQRQDEAEFRKLVRQMAARFDAFRDPHTILTVLTTASLVPLDANINRTLADRAQVAFGDSSDPVERLWLGAALLRAGNAEAAANRLLTIDTSPVALLFLALARLEQGDATNAIEVFNKARDLYAIEQTQDWSEQVRWQQLVGEFKLRSRK